MSDRAHVFCECCGFGVELAEVKVRSRTTDETATLLLCARCRVTDPRKLRAWRLCWEELGRIDKKRAPHGVRASDREAHDVAPLATLPSATRAAWRKLGQR